MTRRPFNRAHLALGLVVQVLAISFGGVWGPAVGGVIIGLFVALSGGAGAFRIGFVSALGASAILLAVIAFRGASLLHFADMVGGNFKLPGGALLAVSVLFPALQSGGLAGGIGRVLERKANP